MNASRTTGAPIEPKWGRIIALLLGIVLAVGVIVWVGPCGDDDAATTAVAGESWSARANAFCADGVQEATALTVPATASQAATDAEARIEIVATVRDGIYTLGEPADLDPTLAAVYVEGLNHDLDELNKVREAAKSGDDYQTLSAELGESSGTTASKLGLDDCATFAQSIHPTQD